MADLLLVAGDNVHASTNEAIYAFGTTGPATVYMAPIGADGGEVAVGTSICIATYDDYPVTVKDNTGHFVGEVRPHGCAWVNPEQDGSWSFIPIAPSYFYPHDAIAAPAGGATVDAEARAAIALMLEALEWAGIVKS
jgi:hypothetical protein